MKRLIHTNFIAVSALAASTLLLSGCGGGEDAGDATTSENTTASAAQLDGIILEAAPTGAQSVEALKASAKEGDEVVVRVIVGGRMEPMVEGRASAVAVDAAVGNKCLSEDDHCTTPWDYCCTPEEQINANLATIEVVDADGRVASADFKQYFQPLSTLVVKGVVGPRPDPKVFSISATGIYIEPKTP